jgi:hypothetical protein
LLPNERTFFASLARQLDAWVRHVIIYNTPDKSGLTKRQHFDKVRAQLEKVGKSKEELDKQFIELVEPELTRIGDDFVRLFFDLSSTARVHVNAGSVKALAVSGAERNPMHPDVPTIVESGVANLDLESWFGYFVPKRTPMDIQDRLRSELAKVIAQPDLQETFRKAGGKPLSLNADQTRALVRRDVERWSKLVRDIGIKAE